MTDTVSMTFLQACIAYFGQQPEQSKMDAGKEFMKLSKEEREEIAALLEKEMGITIPIN